MDEERWEIQESWRNYGPTTNLQSNISYGSKDIRFPSKIKLTKQSLTNLVIAVARLCVWTVGYVEWMASSREEKWMCSQRNRLDRNLWIVLLRCKCFLRLCPPPPPSTMLDLSSISSQFWIVFQLLYIVCKVLAIDIYIVFHLLFFVVIYFCWLVNLFLLFSVFF